MQTLPAQPPADLISVLWVALAVMVTFVSGLLLYLRAQLAQSRQDLLASHQDRIAADKAHLGEVQALHREYRAEIAKLHAEYFGRCEEVAEAGRLVNSANVDASRDLRGAVERLADRLDDAPPTPRRSR
jgi:hypothetical protein